MTASISIRRLYDEALVLPPAERAAFLAAHCPDEAMRVRLAAMLAAEGDTADMPDVLAVPLAELADAIGGPAEPVALSAGRRIGGFQLLDVLGEGGFSTVFRASREFEGVTQHVALKVLHRGLHTPDARRQFRREQRALTQLSHPNIARLIEGGVTDTGLPYIALELVVGARITDYARHQRLDLGQRLRLFMVVCAAVDAAHRALIVHRDLKPSNILVSDDGHVKLLDFGVAKLLDDGDDAARTGARAFTPAYAAPEQRTGEPVTTATDVYALGLLLGELLCGQRPNDGGSATPAARIVDDPPPGLLPTPPVEMRQRLRGDLGAILHKAMAEDPQQRYPSAARLADDLQRLLDQRPIEARASTTWYRVRRFVQRHRSGVAMTVAVVLALLAAAGVTGRQARIAAYQAQRANAVRDLLLQVFSAAEPAGPRLAPPSVVEVVRAAAGEAQRSPHLQPGMRIELISALGSVLRKQGDVAGSVDLLQANQRAALTELRDTDPLRAEAGLALAQAYAEAGQRAQARHLLDGLLARPEPVDGPDLRARLLIASVWLGAQELQRGRPLDESARAVALCTSGCSESTQIAALAARGEALNASYDDAAAIAPMEQALALLRQKYAGPHVEVAAMLQQLSRTQRRLGRLDRAEALAREAVAIAEASLPDPHRARAEALDALWQVLLDKHDDEGAAALGQRVIAIQEAALGPEHPVIASSHNKLGWLHAHVGDYPAAITEFRAALALAESLPGNARRSALFRGNLGGVIGLSGDAEGGIRIVREAIATLRAQAEPDLGMICAMLEKIGRIQYEAGDFAAARATYEEVHGIYREHLKDAPPDWPLYTLIGLGRSLGASGEPAQGIALLRDALARMEAGAKVSPLGRLEARAALAGLLAAQGSTAEANAVAAQARAEAAAVGRMPAALRRLLQQIAGL